MIEDREKLIKWLGRLGNHLMCPTCTPNRLYNFSFSLVKSSFYCERCKQVWRFRYLNNDDSIKKAFRIWISEDKQSRGRILNSGKVIPYKKGHNENHYSKA